MTRVRVRKREERDELTLRMAELERKYEWMGEQVLQLQKQLMDALERQAEFQISLQQRPGHTEMENTRRELMNLQMKVNNIMQSVGTELGCVVNLTTGQFNKPWEPD